MHSALPLILSGIRSDDPDALLGANELLRAYRMGLVGTGVDEPYASMYSAEPFTDGDVEVLKDCLLEYVQDENAKNVSTAVRAFGYLQDRSLVPLLRNLLEVRLRELSAASMGVGQLIVVLNDLGEQLFEHNFSAINIDENALNARRYLYKHGVNVPW
nr:hypothetical protein [uncultured Rhodoferax sp.]